MIKLTFKGKEIEVKERLTFEESVRFVNCVKEEVTFDGYSPLLCELFIATNFMRLYTNIDEVSVDEFYIYLSEYREFISSIMDENDFDTMQYKEILDSIYREIGFEKEKLLHISKLDELLETVNYILVDIHDKLDFEMIMKVAQKLSNMENINQSEVIKVMVEMITKKAGE